MALTQAQKSLIARAQAVGGGEQGVSLNDAACAYLTAVVVRDLGLLPQFRELQQRDFPELFEEPDPAALLLERVPFLPLIDHLITLAPDADMYFACLASLQKSRLKYAQILRCQPVPTMDQVGPRALLQYGQMSPDMLAGFMLWRKWLYDTDNRAAQETGYLFEPVIANAIGGTSVSAKKSPVKRSNGTGVGRQVDCIRDGYAYEIKIRVTIAASGQGRWGEELEFPVDCRTSGFTPVLVVLDPTPNAKLQQLAAAFTAQRGMVYIGDQAWKHLEDSAGPVMSVFIEKYVRSPIQQVLRSASDSMPDICFSMDDDSFRVSLLDETAEFKRTAPCSGTPLLDTE